MFSTFPEAQIKDLNEEYDYIIIGGGTAGCVLASRLSEDEGVSVLLVERGGVSNGWIARVPLLSQYFADTKRTRSRMWKTTAQKDVDNRVFELFSGRSLGGTSKINGLLYTRGVRAEFNSWGAAGRKGWSYDEIREYFVKSEMALDYKPSSSLPDYHGTSGEWRNKSYDVYWRHTHPARPDIPVGIIRASSAMGIPYVANLNSPQHPPNVCAKLHYTIDNDAKRSSTDRAFLPVSLVRRRKTRLHICTHTVGSKIEFGNDDEGQLRAQGVHLQSTTQTSSKRFIRARREIIVSSGPLASPQLLLLSGVGPAAHLKEHDIPVIKDLPGVDSRLQDHPAIPLHYSVPLRDFMARIMVKPWLIIGELFRYLFFGSGLLRTHVHELSIFLQSRCILPANIPDIELTVDKPEYSSPKGKGGFFLMGTLLKPTSTGTVRLASTGPLEDPIIDPNYLSTESDRLLARKCVQVCKQLKKHVVADGCPMDDHTVPGDNDDNEAIDKYIRSQVMSTFHYSSTCRMAPERGAGVVDDRLRVHGVKGLRVADSSIFPEILSTHLAAATVMVAEKCADMIREEYILSAQAKP